MTPGAWLKRQATHAEAMIRACSVCADTTLRMPGFSDGVVPEIDNLQDYVCGNGHKMTPFEFQKRAEYEAFREAITD